MKLPATFIYRAMPFFFSALRAAIKKFGSNNIYFYLNEESRRIGFRVEKDIFTIDIATVRQYYNTVYAQEDKVAKKEATLFANDVARIYKEYLQLN